MALGALLALLALGGCGGEDSNEAAQTEATTVAQAPKTTPTDQSDPKPEQTLPSKEKAKEPEMDAGEAAFKELEAEARRNSADPNSKAKTDGSAKAPTPSPEPKGEPAGAEVVTDKEIENYGSAAPATDRDLATESLLGYIAASSAEQWQKACGFLTAETRGDLEQLASASGRYSGCAPVLAALTANLPGPAKRSLVSADVSSLRIEGTSGYLLYRGSDGTTYSIAVAKDGSGWKVASIGGNPHS